MTSPCPYCQEAEISAVRVGEHFQIQCDTCGVTGPLQESEAYARQAWAFLASLGEESRDFTGPTDLTERQKEVYDFMAEFFQTEDRLPSYEDICQRFGWSSTNSARSCIEGITKKGGFSVHVGNREAKHLVWPRK